METGEKFVISGIAVLFAIWLYSLGSGIYQEGQDSSNRQTSKQIAVDTVESAEQLGIVLHINIHDNWFDLVEHDAWGFPLRGKQEGGKVYVKWAGPDHIWGTADDVEYMRYVVASPLPNLGASTVPPNNGLTQ